MGPVAGVAVLAVVLLACGNGDGAAEVPIGDIASLPSGQTVEVTGAVVVTGDEARICEALAESFPPQCGGDNVVLAGFDVAQFEDLLTSGPASSDVRWAESLTIVGTTSPAGLDVAVAASPGS